MTHSLKAIETIYPWPGGPRYRSRLEARWAVFFDTLGMNYEYEKEGFDLGGAGWYLPDFWLPGPRVFVEIKGSSDPDSDLKKWVSLALSGERIAIFSGGFSADPHVGTLFFSNEGTSVLAGGPIVWGGCPLCGSSGFLCLPSDMTKQTRPNDPIVRRWARNQCAFLCHNTACLAAAQQWIKLERYAPWNHHRIKQAHTAAQQARFEHGESGARP